MKLAPIVLFAYNRPWHLRWTIEALQKNELADKSDLFIFSDAPSSSKDEENVIIVRRFIRTISGFKSIELIERKENFGLARSIIYGVTEIVNKWGKIIVMEDDLVSSPLFLKFVNEGLEFYKDENRMISIHGYMFPINAKLPSTFFLRFADCLGWATWQRGWTFFETEGKKLLTELKERNLEKKFDINRSYPYTRMLKNQIKGKNDSWAIRWYASAFLKNKLSLYPARSLIQHIGNDDSGVNFGTSKILDSELSKQPIFIDKIPIEENYIALREFEKYLRSIRPMRLLNSIHRRLSNLKITRKY
jgi:hypothetical protein